MPDYNRSDIENAWEKRREQLVVQAAGKVEKIYNDAANKMAGYFNQVKPTGSASNVWSKNPKVSKKIDNVLKDFQKELSTQMNQSFKDGWHLNNDKHDELMSNYLSGVAIGEELKKGMFDRNLKAMEAFLNEGFAGETISDRVWNLSKQYKKQLSFFAASGIGSGRDSRKIARDLKTYLQNPDKRFRRVRDPKTGKLKLSKPAAAYHPGAGVYRSSYKNALRYTATETNRAYRVADFNRIQNEPFVTGVKIQLSAAHNITDICDEMVGTYPKGYKFGGFHPFCICSQTTITLGKKNFAQYMKNKKVPGNKYVNDIPSNARNYLNKNLSKLKGRKDLPQFMKDNFDTSGNKVGLLGGTVPEGATQAAFSSIQQTNVRELTKDEMQSLTSYKGGKYRAINRHLRGGQIPKDLQREVTRDIKNIDSALRHSPKYKGTTYRGMSFENKADFDNFASKMEKGNYTSDKSFMSTTKDENIVKNFLGEDEMMAYRAKVKVKGKGKSGADLTKNVEKKGGDIGPPKEGEVLFERNTKFKIEKAEIKDVSTAKQTRKELDIELTEL